MKEPTGKICITERPSTGTWPNLNPPQHYLLPAKLSQQQRPQWQVTEGLVTAAEALISMFTETERERERKFEKILTL